MSISERLSIQGRGLLNRRGFLRNTGLSMGGLALAQLLAGDGLLAGETRSQGEASPVAPQLDPSHPYAPRKPHFEAAAKQVLVIFCPGAVSHVDTFDYKPALFRFDGQRPPGLPAVTFAGPTGNLAKPFWEFKPRGETGKMVSELLPHLAQQVDDFCFFHALTTTTSAHPQGENFFNTGFTREGFPSFGAWATYALGTENQQLPAFVAINDPRGLARSGKNNFGSGFLPAAFQATDFNVMNPPANLARPASYTAKADRRTIDLVRRLNARHLEQYPDDADLAARIASYELAGKMQTSIPEVMNLSDESSAALESYGVNSGSTLKRQYAQNCILARRLIEKGVRVVQLFNGSDPAGGNGITNWDSHSKIAETHAMQAEIMDQPTAALIADLKQRGLLDQTLVVWCTEFGRMPFLQANGTGRDHNPSAFTCFLTGAGVRRGFSYGESDEFGYRAAINETSVYDFNATLLHLMGLDHERLTFYHNGLQRRLTDVHGRVIQDVLA